MSDSLKIIACEGVDASGKETQSIKLVDRLIKEGYRVKFLEFPQYHSPIGKMIKKYLHNEIRFDPYTFELLMSADKQSSQNMIKQYESRNIDYLIIDRYTLSQEVYARANGHDEHWCMELQRFMRQPDLEILIDIPVEESLRRKGRMGKNDKYEKDKELLEKVRKLYLEEAQKINRSNWKQGFVKIIDGMKSVDEIHQEIVDFVLNQ